ncbi:MAG: hypothetical protein WAU86_22895 [Oricola sp.]
MGVEGHFKSDLKAGYVYVLSCPHMPDTIRIGSTLRDVGKLRHEPFGTIAPTSCKVEFSIHVPDRLELERVLQQKFAHALRPGAEQLYAVCPDEVIAAIIEHTGFDYTNAQVTGVIFRKQVQALRKSEADLRNRRKSLSVMTSEVSELRMKLRECRGAIEEKDREIARLTSRIEETTRARKAKLRLSVLVGSAALVFVAGALSFTSLI